MSPAMDLDHETASLQKEVQINSQYTFTKENGSVGRHSGHHIVHSQGIESIPKQLTVRQFES